MDWQSGKNRISLLLWRYISFGTRLVCQRRLFASSALLLAVDLQPQVANQDRPHAGIAVQQDLQVLVPQKGDLAAHVVEQTLHVVEVDSHLRQIVTRFARRWLRRSLRRSVCLTLPALSHRTEPPVSALRPYCRTQQKEKKHLPHHRCTPSQSVIVRTGFVDGRLQRELNSISGVAASRLRV